jgi:hypothetical protein
MFKNNFALCGPNRRRDPGRRRRRRLAPGLALLLLAGLSACRTVPPLQKVNLAEPGWTIHEGQAIWRYRPDSPEITGDLLAATRSDGSVFVEFSKTPFPLVVALQTTNAWQIKFPPQNTPYFGIGGPPPQFIWFQLARALTGTNLSPGWAWHGSNEDWRLDNTSTREIMAGYFKK